MRPPKLPSQEFESRAQLETRPQYVSTLAHGLDVLRCFAAGGPQLGNKEIAERLGLTRPTVSRLTFTLVGLGYLCRDARTGKYALGPAVLSLGYPLLAHMTLRQLAAHDMIELARLARGPVSLGMRDRLQVVYAETVHDRDSNSTRPDIGSTRPMLRTAIGRALLWAHGQAERARLCERLAEELPGEWERFGPALPDAFGQIEARGFCVVCDDWQPALYGAAVPLRYRVNDVPLAFNVTVQAHLAGRDFLERELGPRLCALVRNLESRLGVG